MRAKTDTFEPKSADEESSRSKYAVAGIYPYDNPKYAIVVMTEKGKSGSEDCCPIFRTIVDELEKI